MAVKKNFCLLGSGLIYLWVAVIVFLLDRITKSLALNYLSISGESLSLIPGFNLTLVFNRGASFGFLGDLSGWQVWFLSLVAIIVSIVIVYLLARTSAKKYLFNLSLVFILGGAIGNLYDRFVYASVIDFLDLYIRSWHWPAFNLADSAICFGVFLMLVDSFWKKNNFNNRL